MPHMAQGCGGCENGSGPGNILLESASTKMAKMSLLGEEETDSGPSLDKESSASHGGECSRGTLSCLVPT